MSTENLETLGPKTTPEEVEMVIKILQEASDEGQLESQVDVQNIVNNLINHMIRDRALMLETPAWAWNYDTISLENSTLLSYKWARGERKLKLEIDPAQIKTALDNYLKNAKVLSN